MSSSLSGLRILVTRPDPQHNEICTAIEENGGQAFHFPLIKIEPIASDDQIASVKSKIENLDNFQILIFISNNAAHYGAEWINDYWPQFPVGLDVIAVGPSTARKVSAELNCTAIHSTLGASSEDVLELDQLKQVDGKKIAIVRGVGGRELLADRLRERGATVDYIEVYTRAAADNTSKQLELLLNSEQINVYSVTSGQSLNRLCQLLEQAGDMAQSGKTPIIVPSTRVAKQAEHLGFASVQLAKGADVEATIIALQELAN